MLIFEHAVILRLVGTGAAVMCGQGRVQGVIALSHVLNNRPFMHTFLSCL